MQPSPDHEDLSGQAVQAPGLPYDSHWHVSREREEESAWRLLEAAGAPVVLWGPKLYGKSWALGHLLDRLRQGKRGLARVIGVDLRLFDGASLVSPDAFLHRLAASIVASLGLPEAALSAAWSRPSHAMSKLTWLMGIKVLPEAEEPLILAIDHVDAVCGAAFQDDFFGLLRAWVEQSYLEPWSRLRLLLALSTSPVLLRTTTAASPFNIVPPVELGDLDDAQVGQLAELHGLDWTDEDLHALMGWVGGHPCLVRVAIYEAAKRGASLAELSGNRGRDGGIFQTHLHEQVDYLRAHPPLLEAVRRLLAANSASLSPDTYHPLNSAGLIVQQGADYRFRCPLYTEYLRAAL